MKLNKKIDTICTSYNLYDTSVRSEILTELTLFDNLKNIDFGDYRLVNFASGSAFRALGKRQCQNIINKIINGKNKKYIFMCQAVNVHLVNWGGNIVFTPHLWDGHPENIKAIPHYSLNIKDIKPISVDTPNLFCFIGAEYTHPIRKLIVNMYDTCHDTYKWMSESYKSKFFDMMENSKFSLCPRGTGLGTIRLFETMGMKRVPVILSNGFVPPLDWKVDWNEFSVRIHEKNYDKIPEILSRYSHSDICRMAQKAYDVWDEFFSPKSMHKVIILEMNKLISNKSNS